LVCLTRADLHTKWRKLEDRQKEVQSTKYKAQSTEQPK